MRIELSTHEQSVIKIDPREIRGNWCVGYALDFHTAQNTNQTHTKIGAWVHLVKKSDRNSIRPLAEVAAKFVKEKFVDNDHIVCPSLVIPVLPSESRPRTFQPVFEIAKEIGKILNLPYKEDYLIKVRQTRPIKDLTSADKQEELRGAFAVQPRNSQHLQGEVILLVDDIYDSGETLKEVTDVLKRQGGVRHVLVLTLTRTRKKR